MSMIVYNKVRKGSRFPPIILKDVVKVPGETFSIRDRKVRPQGRHFTDNNGIRNTFSMN
jgi:hypothetical protein